MYSKLTITAPANINGNLNTFLGATLPVGDRWTGTTVNLADQSGYIFTSTGSGSYNYDLKFVFTYNATKNFCSIYSGELIDMAAATNLLVNPGFEAATMGVPDTWTLDGVTLTSTTTDGFYYLGSKGGRVANASTTLRKAFYQVVSLNAAVNANHVISAYVKPIGTTVITDIKLYAQADAGGVDYTANALVNDTAVALEDGWYRISSHFTATTANWKLGIVVLPGESAFVDGIMAEKKATNVATAYTNYSGANQVKGAVLRNTSETYNIYFTEDADAITANQIFMYINANKDSVAFVLGNSDDGMYNAAFYGKLVTPTGEPIDSGNSTGCDVTCVAIGTSCHTGHEGEMALQRDSNGKWWQYYQVYDTANVDTHNFWGGGLASKYNTWGQKTFIPFMKSLFMKDVYWKDRINMLCLFHPREGFRGYLPNLYSINEDLGYSGSGNIFVTPRHRVWSGTATGGDTNTLTDTNTNFTTDIVVAPYDVIYRPSTGEFFRVASGGIGANSLDTIETSLVAWTTQDYELYRGVAFDVLPVGFAPTTWAQPIAGISGNDSFTVDTDVTSQITALDAITMVEGANNASYTVHSSVYDAGDGTTEIVVHENIASNTVTGSIYNTTLASTVHEVNNTTDTVTLIDDRTGDMVHDEVIRLFGNSVAAKNIEYTVDSAALRDDYIRIAGSHVAEFTAVDDIDVWLSTANDGIYTVSDSYLSGGKTYINLTTDLPDDTVDGKLANVHHTHAIDHVMHFAKVDGDHTTTFLAGSPLTVNGSTGNDGVYTQDTNSQLIGGDTNIVITTTFPDTTVDGDIWKTTETYLVTDVQHFVKVAGDHHLLFLTGNTLTIDGSTGNDGNYTQDTNSYVAGTNTDIVITGSLPSAVVDGTIWNNANSYAVTDVQDFVRVAGNHTANFLTGKTLRIADSTGNDGTYTEDTTSTSIGGNTNIVITTTFPDTTVDGNIWNETDDAYAVTDVQHFVKVAGNQSASFVAAKVLSVVGSVANDGQYTVDTNSTFDTTNTNIVVTGVFPASDVSGKILNFTDNAQDITGVGAGGAGVNYFTVAGDQTLVFPALSTFYVANSSGTPTNNGLYTVTSVTFDGGTHTDIVVDEVIPDTTDHTGGACPSTLAFTVLSVGPKIIRVGGNQSVEFNVVGTIRVYGSTGNDGTYTIARAVADGASTNIEVTADFPDLTADGKLILGANIFPITNVGTKIIRIGGNHAVEFNVVDSIRVNASTGNDGTYTIANAVVDGANTNIEVTTEFPSGTADGRLVLASNTFTITGAGPKIVRIGGNHAAEFASGTIRLYDSSNNDGTYTIVSAVVDGASTNIEVATNFVDLTADGRLILGSKVYPIIGIGPKILRILGSHAALYPAGSAEIYGSTGNDGVYTIASSLADGGDTNIEVTVDLPDLTGDGNIVMSSNVYAVDGVETRDLTDVILQDNIVGITSTGKMAIVSNFLPVVEVFNGDQYPPVNATFNQFTSYSKRTSPKVRHTKIVLGE